MTNHQKNPEDYYGRGVLDASFNNSEIHLTFDDGIKIKIWDDTQTCCEKRYMTCDDNVKDLIGKKLISIKTKEHRIQEEEYGYEHEIVFLEIKAGHETVTFANHNEHNGYYGGFYLSLNEYK